MILFVFGLGLLYFAEWAALNAGLRTNPGADIFVLTVLIVSIFLISIARVETPLLATIRAVLGFVNGLGLILISLYVIYDRILTGRFDVINWILSPLNILIGFYILFTSLQQAGAFGNNETVLEE